MNLSRLRVVVSNTGPLISALQCGRMDILRQFYDEIHIPASEMPEYEKYGVGLECRHQGTHYALAFIEEIYERLRRCGDE